QSAPIIDSEGPIDVAVRAIELDMSARLGNAERDVSATPAAGRDAAVAWTSRRADARSARHEQQPAKRDTGRGRPHRFNYRAFGRGASSATIVIRHGTFGASRPSAPQLSVVLRRPADLAHRHLDAANRAVVAGVPAHAIGGASRTRLLRRPDSRFPVRADRR